MRNKDSHEIENLYLEHISYSNKEDDPIRRYGIIRPQEIKYKGQPESIKFPKIRKTTKTSKEDYSDIPSRVELDSPELKDVNEVNKPMYKMYMAGILDSLEKDYASRPKIRYIFDDNKKIRDKILNDLLRGFSDNFRVELVSYDKEDPIFKLQMNKKNKFIKVYLSDNINDIRYESVPPEELE